MTYKDLADLVNEPKFNFDSIFLSRDNFDENMPKISSSGFIEATLYGIKCIIEEWLPDDTILFRLGKEIVAMMKGDKLYINPKYQTKKGDPECQL